MKSVIKTTAGIAPSIPAFIRQRELMTLLPFSSATLWRKVRNGTFVQPLKLSERVTAWKRADVLAWIESKGGVQ